MLHWLLVFLPGAVALDHRAPGHRARRAARSTKGAYDDPASPRGRRFVREMS
jgi:hypothetical protein